MVAEELGLFRALVAASDDLVVQGSLGEHVGGGEPARRRPGEAVMPGRVTFPQTSCG
jgi:hypothetical protein